MTEKARQARQALTAQVLKTSLTSFINFNKGHDFERNQQLTSYGSRISVRHSLLSTGSDSLQIFDIFIRDDIRNQGVFTDILAHAERAAFQQEYGWIEIHGVNSHRFLTFLLKRGYRQFGDKKIQPNVRFHIKNGPPNI